MKVRIGIDVGGTFTDVVVIHGGSHELVGQLKLPTTHAAREGVAQGIVSALSAALQKFSLRPEDIGFIAHSTTQATNALLEGDVAAVGIVGIGRGVEAVLARRATRVPPVALTPSRLLAPLHRFVRLRNGSGAGEIRRCVEELSRSGVQVVVGSEAFGVDHARWEDEVAGAARAAGLLATTGHEVSGLYGLRVRTRTAVINAAILPRMIETAVMTDRSVRAAGIKSPLMIMRSDGGVMSVAEVHRRPILTMLSGPAAGIAGALMHEKVSDGIFLEVGGTSTDISVIRDGSPATRPARLNGHRMYLNTLDVRTLGIAGGSMVRAHTGGDHEVAIVDVGPRSAHIAGLGYTCFADPEEIGAGALEFVRPSEQDAGDHAVIRVPSGRSYALTTTCAANLLGLVREGDFARGNAASARRAFEILAGSPPRKSGGPEELAGKLLAVAAGKIAPVVEDLIVEYGLDRRNVVLVGGGGGASALVPFVARFMHLDHRIARNNEVISPIGVAMAMVRDTVERNIVDPKPEDVLRVRREAMEAAISAGAAADTVEVEVEVDKRRNLVRASAVGTTEMRRRGEEGGVRTAAECRQAAARSMHVAAESVTLAAAAGNFMVFTAEEAARRLLGLVHSRVPHLRVVDRTAVVRLQRGRAIVRSCAFAAVRDVMERAGEEMTDYGDAGRNMPDVFVLYGGRIANFSGLADLDQLLALSAVEFRLLDPSTPMAVIACPKH